MASCAALSFVESLLVEKEEMATLLMPCEREPWLQDLLTESRHASEGSRPNTYIVKTDTGAVTGDSAYIQAVDTGVAPSCTRRLVILRFKTV